jgi:hypothetical protein
MGELLGTGKRAVGGTLAGGAWLAWGLSAAGTIALPVIVALSLVFTLLLLGCGYCIRKGWRLRSEHPHPRRPLNRGFLFVTVLEAAGAAGVITVAQKLDRLDALPDWIGIVIGLHFFGVAKVFHSRVYYVTGIAITVWCLLAWALFQGDPLTVAAGLGTGAILWATSSFNVMRVLAPVRHATAKGKA